MSVSLAVPLYFFDSSALVKRYGAEIGTAWVTRLCDPEHGNVIAVARITLAEVAAALASKRRANAITLMEYDQALQDAKDDFQECVRQDVDQTVIDWAVELTQHHKLRGYDAVQLASALTLNTLLVQQQLAPLTFVASDHDLLAAAQGEGLATEDPTRHP